MYEEVHTFALRPCTSTNLHHGTLVHMDVDVHEIIVVLNDTTPKERRVLRISPHDCSEAIQRIAELNDGVSRIECDVEDDGRVVALRLMVDSLALERRLTGNGFASEEHVINLCLLQRKALPWPRAHNQSICNRQRTPVILAVRQ